MVIVKNGVITGESFMVIVKNGIIVGESVSPEMLRKLVAGRKNLKKGGNYNGTS